MQLKKECSDYSIIITVNFIAYLISLIMSFKLSHLCYRYFYKSWIDCRFIQAKYS